MEGLPEEGQLLFWLGKATRAIREEAGLVRSQVVGHESLAKDVGVLVGFEKGDSFPRERDQIWVVLAELAELDGPHVILRRAAELWEADAKGDSK